LEPLLTLIKAELSSLILQSKCKKYIITLYIKYKHEKNVREMHSSCNLEARKLVSDPITAQPLANLDYLAKKLLILSHAYTNNNNVARRPITG
jgi:hypothetical protein